MGKEEKKIPVKTASRWRRSGCEPWNESKVACRSDSATWRADCRATESGFFLLIPLRHRIYLTQNSPWKLPR